MSEKYYPMSIMDQETTIAIARSDAYAMIWCSDRTMITKLDRLCKEHPENYECNKVVRSADTHEIVDKSYIVKDKSLISFRGAKVKRELTDEQRKELADRLKASRQNQK